MTYRIQKLERLPAWVTPKPGLTWKTVNKKQRRAVAERILILRLTDNETVRLK